MLQEQGGYFIFTLLVPFHKVLLCCVLSCRNINFLKKYGITHVLNTAEGVWAEHCVDLSQDHYIGSGITYLVSRSSFAHFKVT